MRCHVHGPTVYVALRALAPYMSRETEARPHLAGIYVEIRESGLSLTATDGHRLAHVEIACINPEHGAHLISAATVEHAIRSLKTERGRIELTSDGNTLTMLGVRAAVVSKTHTYARFPNYRTMMGTAPLPTHATGMCATRVTFNADYLQDVAAFFVAIQGPKSPRTKSAELRSRQVRIATPKSPLEPMRASVDRYCMPLDMIDATVILMPMRDGDELPAVESPLDI